METSLKKLDTYMRYYKMASCAHGFFFVLLVNYVHIYGSFYSKKIGHFCGTCLLTNYLTFSKLCRCDQWHFLNRPREGIIYGMQILFSILIYFFKDYVKCQHPCTVHVALFPKFRCNPRQKLAHAQYTNMGK